MQSRRNMCLAISISAFLSQARARAFMQNSRLFFAQSFLIQSPSKKMCLGFDNWAWFFQQWLNGCQPAGWSVGCTMPLNFKNGQAFSRDSVFALHYRSAALWRYCGYLPSSSGNSCGLDSTLVRTYHFFVKSAMAANLYIHYFSFREKRF